jgi:small subunit ribosomal protein S16
MLTIRFSRIGKKNQPSFKIVVTEKTNSSTRGRFVEQVGTFNPRTKEKTLKPERIKYWVSVGAQPSPSIHNLLISEKIIEGKKIDVHNKSKTQAVAKGENEATASLPKAAEKPAEGAVPNAVPVPEKPAAPTPEPVTEPKSE